MSNYTWPVTMLEEHKVPVELLKFFQGYVEDYDKSTKKLETLYEEHKLLQATSSKQERYIAELEKQIGLLQKTLDLVDKNKPRFILQNRKPSQDEFFDSLNSAAIIPTGETSIVPIYPDRWIPVSERLPEEYEPVLVYNPNVDHGKTVMEATRSDNGWKTEFDFEAYENNEITHWMPLPEPPEGE